MNCDDSHAYLPAYLDDELGIAESLLVQKHLSRCEDCRRIQNQQNALRTALRDPDLVAHPSADFSGRLQAVVRQAAKEEARAQHHTKCLGKGDFALQAGVTRRRAGGSRIHDL